MEYSHYVVEIEQEREYTNTIVASFTDLAKAFVFIEMALESCEKANAVIIPIPKIEVRECDEDDESPEEGDE